MADIDVERKSTNIWPWILGLIGLLLVGWLLVEMLDDEVALDVAPVGAVEGPAVVPTPAPVVNPVTPVTPDAVAEGNAVMIPAVQEYLTACTAGTADMSLDHQYTSNCIQRLSTSIDALLQNPDLAGIDVQAQFQDYRQKAERLVQSPETSGQHANITREAFTSMATLLNAVQDARYPGLESQVSELEQAATAVQGNVEMLNQKEAVQRFFGQAGNVLTGMVSAPASPV